MTNQILGTSKRAAQVANLFLASGAPTNPSHRGISEHRDLWIAFPLDHGENRCHLPMYRTTRFHSFVYSYQSETKATHRKSSEATRTVSSLAAVESLDSCFFASKFVKTDVDAGGNSDRVFTDQDKVPTISKLDPSNVKRDHHKKRSNQNRNEEKKKSKILLTRS